ncbi:MAG: hypothetical protein AAFU70_13530, partial [Planctomycetota bacterium]
MHVAQIVLLAAKAERGENGVNLGNLSGQRDLLAQPAIDDAIGEADQESPLGPLILSHHATDVVPPERTEVSPAAPADGIGSL